MSCATDNTKHQTKAAKPIAAVVCVRICGPERRQDPGTEAGSFMG